MQSFNLITDEFLLDCEASGLATSTINLYRWHISELIKRTAIVSIDQFNTHNIRVFFASLQKDNYSSSSISNFWRGISKFCNWLIKQDYITLNPLQKLTKPRKPTTLPKFLDNDAIKKILSASTETTNPERDYCIMCIMLDCGLRRAETATLQVNDIDITRGTIAVRSAKCQSVRLVPFCKKTQYALQIWLTIRDKKLKTLFGLKGNGIYQLIERIAKKAKIKISPHGLRHTMATHYDGALDDLQQLLGHKQIQTTAEIYRHRNIDKLITVHETRSALSQTTSETLK